MGQLISLTARIAERTREGSNRHPAAFFFTLNCPVAYLVAERIERELGEIAWVPMLTAVDPGRARERFRRAASVAGGHRLALAEPDPLDFDPRPVSRAAAHAAQRGGSGGFALAALRLAFAGGYDLSEPDLIAEAAAASGQDVEAALVAAADPSWDRGLLETAAALRARGIVEGPAVRIRSGWFSGFEALDRSSAFTAARASFHALANPA